MVKSVEVDVLIDPMPAGRLPKASERVAWAIPNVLEYLLVQHGTVIYVDIGHFVDQSTIPDILKRVEQHGEVLLPGADYSGKPSQQNPVTNKSVFPLLAYSRSGFVRRIKPHLDCRRGIYCRTRRGSVDRPHPGSILKKGAIALRRVDPRLRPKMELLAVWNAEPTYETLYQPANPASFTAAMLAASRKLMVGIGIDIAAEETVQNFVKGRLGTLVASIRGQDRRHILCIIYITNYATAESADQLAKEVATLSLPTNVLLKIATSTGAAAGDFVKDTAALEALRDGCQNYFKFGQSAAIPSAATGWLQSVAKYGSLRQGPLVIMTGISGDEHIWMLRELVGSIHGAIAMHPMQPPPSIVILGSQLSLGVVEMIKMWQHVEYQDLDTLLVGSPMNSSLSLADDRVRLAALEVIVGRAGHAVWMSPHVAVPETSVLERVRAEMVKEGHILVRMPVEGRTEYVMEGFDEAALERIHGVHLRCIKGDMDSCSASTNLTDYASVGKITEGGEALKLQVLLPKPPDDRRSQHYCDLSLRPEIMYNSVAFPQVRMAQWAHGEEDARLLRETNKTKIAFLIPSKNKVTETPEQIHLVSNFLRSLLASITAEEWGRFQYVLYVGYDRDDPVLDERRGELKDVLDALLGGHQSSVLVKFHQLPTAKCITLLWNILFVDAVQDGNDYFYQVNDDVTLESPGWSTVFVNSLRAKGDFGVVGPNDRMWDCRLLTQSFVSRRHYEIFRWYFPIEIKDWYSDNWVSQVYGAEHTQCLKALFIRNGASSTRYNVCSVPKWREAVIEGQHRIRDWQAQKDHKLVLAHAAKQAEAEGQKIEGADGAVQSPQ